MSVLERVGRVGWSIAAFAVLWWARTPLTIVDQVCASIVGALIVVSILLEVELWRINRKIARHQRDIERASR